MGLEPRDLARSPATMPFSKIRNVARLDEEAALGFFNSLYRAAVESKDDGDWSRVERLLQEWEDRLTSRTAAGALSYPTAPWTPLPVPLAEARLALIGTGGVYLRDEQDPFDTDGDASFRVIPRGTPHGRIGVAHTHYDTAGALRDVNVIFPYQRLKELEDRGRIGVNFPGFRSSASGMPILPMSWSCAASWTVRNRRPPHPTSRPRASAYWATRWEWPWV